jgi:hypothetical protein
MNGILIVIIICIVTVSVAASIGIAVRESKWQADLQTYNGRAKLAKLRYEHLELTRLRALHYHRGYHADSDYIVIPFDAPMKTNRTKQNRTWKFVTKFTSFDSPLGFQSDDQFDELRLYGYKDGRKQLVFKYAYYPENYSDLKKRVDEYNEKMNNRGRIINGKS